MADELTRHVEHMLAVAAEPKKVIIAPALSLSANCRCRRFSQVRKRKSGIDWKGAYVAKMPV